MSLLEEALKQNQLTIDNRAQAQLSAYLDLLSKWNKVFNLTTITTTHDMVYLHIIDSLVIAPYIHGQNCLDVGSGAGLPGIPLAITHPLQQWTLLDKNNKKTRFLTQVVAELGLKNVEIVHSRCEDFDPAVGFDSILSRAFGTLEMFTSATSHLLQQGGIFIAMKGKYPEDEISQLPSNMIVNKAEKIAIKGIDIERHVICLLKH